MSYSNNSKPFTFPCYVIIGKDGRIFDNDAPRPSQDITPKRINEALAVK